MTGDPLDSKLLELFSLGEKLGLGKARVCLVHGRVNVCRVNVSPHVWSEDPEDVATIAKEALERAAPRRRRPA